MSDSAQLRAVLERAADTAARAAHELAELRNELVALMTSRTNRPWTPDEFERYLSLTRHDAATERAYSTARRTFDHARLQLRRDSHAMTTRDCRPS
jgi:hypothetical protein